MANRKESCYEKKPLTCMYYAGNGKPRVNPCTVTFQDGSVKKFKSANEYKAWRKQRKSAIKKARKVVK
jgi:hypothetical protein